MKNGPLRIAWDIVCPSPAATDIVREVLDRTARLDTIQRVTMTRGDTVQEETYRLGDFFQDVHLETAPDGTAHTLRIAFARLPNAGRYWRDLMVRILQSAHEACEGVRISMAYRIEDTVPAGGQPDQVMAGSWSEQEPKTGHQPGSESPG
jgi:hypothetical protein